VKAPEPIARSEARPALDVAPIQRLIEAILARWRAEEIWLFGSRARGEARPNSDWDLLVVVPDELPETELDPLVAWGLQRRETARAEVVPCRASDFREDRTTPNTLAYEAATRGVRLYPR
jgi:predicted nucleotidyltransferase